MADSVFLVCDIGGTYARFAVSEGGEITRFMRYRAEDFPSFADALDAYAGEVALKKKPPLLIATAAYEDGPVWRFINNNTWVLDAGMLAQAGWGVRLILNDFAAATWGLLALDASGVKRLNDRSVRGDLPRCLLGPGTGLGLGYLYPLANEKYHVQRTHGGHMPAAAMTKEQAGVLEALQRTMPPGRAVVYETLVSGPGLVNIYNTLSTDRVQQAQDVLQSAGTETGGAAIRLFHEFWGLFAATSVVCGHAYGGLYLTGGMASRFDEAGLLDTQRFTTFFTCPAAVSVRDALASTPLMLVTDPHLTFKGLLQAAGGGA